MSDTKIASFVVGFLLSLALIAAVAFNVNNIIDTQRKIKLAEHGVVCSEQLVGSGHIVEVCEALATQ